MLGKVNQEVIDIEVPGIRVFSNRVTQYEDGVNLTIGEPDFSTPENIKRVGIEAIHKNHTGYTHNAGLLELREAVASFFYDQYHLSYNPENEIIITNGVSQGIDSILRTILQPGDEVIIPAPIYSAYEPIVHLLGAKVIYLNTADNQFQPDPEELERLITDRTKAVILNYPCNPTGTVLSKDLMDEIAAVLDRHEIFVLSDEIYSENMFFEEHHSFASYSELRDKLFLLHGLSKSHAMTGWRIGYILGPKYLMEQVLKVHLYNVICASTPGQYAAIEALQNSRNSPDEMNKAYIERSEYVYKRLKDMGFEVEKPVATFYIFPSIRKFSVSSLEFAERLLEEYHVAIVPGSAFTEFGEGSIRISFANSLENLKEGMDRIEQFISSL